MLSCKIFDIKINFWKLIWEFEVIKAFGELYKTGWRPKRSLMFASWGSEEYGLIGSQEMRTILDFQEVFLWRIHFFISLFLSPRFVPLQLCRFYDFDPLLWGFELKIYLMVNIQKLRRNDFIYVSLNKSNRFNIISIVFTFFAFSFKNQDE